MKPLHKSAGPDAEPAQPSDVPAETPVPDTFALERDALAASLHGRVHTTADDAPDGEAPPSGSDGTPS